MKRDAAGKFVTNWNSETKRRVNISLTDTAWHLLDEAARKQGISRSEVIEHFARSLEDEPLPEQTQLPDSMLRQQAEALENQQKWLETVLDVMPTPLVFVEPTTAKITFSNQIANELAGGDLPKYKSLEEYADAYYCTDEKGDRLPTESIPSVLLARGEPLKNYELNWHTPGGIRATLCWGETLPALYGHPAIGILMFQDITRLKQAEDDLRQTEERLQLALSSSGMVAWDMDLITQQVICSPNALEIWGVQVGTAADFVAVIHPDDRPRVQQATERAIAGERYYKQEYRVVGSDGAVRWLMSQGQVYLNADGQGVRMTGISVNVTERKQIEEALRQSEERYRNIVETADEGIWSIDAETRTTFVNRKMAEMLGYSEAEMMGRPLYDFMDDTGKQQAEYRLERRKQGIREHHDFCFCRRDGSSIWTMLSTNPLFNDRGSFVGALAMITDVTERKRAEIEREQLLERERIARAQAEAAQHQLATIFETSPVGLALLDAEQRFVAINDALAEIHGLTREQHLGYSISQVFGESNPALVEVFDQIYSIGNPFISPSFAVNLPSRDDRQPGYYNVYYLPTVNSNHQVVSVLVYVVDVTERVRLERAQRFLSEASAVLSSSLDYQTTLEQVAQLTVPELADWCTVHVVEEDGTIDQIAVAHSDPAKLEWARQLSQKYPLDPDSPHGTAYTLRTGQSDLITDIPDQMLVQAARDPEHLEILRQIGFKSFMTVPLRTQTRILGVMSFIFAESGRRYNLATLQLAEDLARRASLAIENAQLYRVAQRDRAKAESANRIKDEFLAVLSHELRSPLNPILGWTKLLRSGRLDITKVDQALETIERNAKLQAQLIEDLLDVSRILQGKMTVNVAPVNLATTIAAALETVRLAAEVKSLDIQTTFKPIAGTVLGDMNRLQQVVWNLLTNAVKFTPPGGRIEIHLEQVNRYAQIQVKDTGRGINPIFIPHVFDYFRQEDGTTTRQFGGLGLGLAIVRHLTELHGGTVQVDSPGQHLGSTFTIQLPLNIVEQTLSAPKVPALDTIDLSKLQVLVVDDDPDMRDLAAFILRQSGAQVITAASAAQALTVLTQSSPDLLLCDVGMPEMDGYALIQQVRKWSPDQGGAIPAIALTAYAGEINQQQALTAGFQMHIAKPVEPEALVKAIALLTDAR